MKEQIAWAKEAITNFLNIDILHVRRSANQLADLLANLATEDMEDLKGF